MFTCYCIFAKIFFATHYWPLMLYCMQDSEAPLSHNSSKSNFYPGEDRGDHSGGLGRSSASQGYPGLNSQAR